MILCGNAGALGEVIAVSIAEQEKKKEKQFLVRFRTNIYSLLRNVRTHSQAGVYVV